MADTREGTGGGGTFVGAFFRLGSYSRKEIYDALIKGYKKAYVIGASGLVSWGALAEDSLSAVIAMLTYGFLSAFGAFVNANLHFVDGMRGTAVNLVEALLGSQQVAISSSFQAATQSIQSGGALAWLLAVVELIVLAYFTTWGYNYAKQTLLGGSGG